MQFTSRHAIAILLGFGAFTLAAQLTEEDGPSGVHGRYVEARSASVFAGPCHVNAEANLQGRNALVGWSFMGGEWDGVELEGVRVAAAISSESNLADGAERWSRIYVDGAAEELQRAAALAWLASEQAEVLGTVEAVADVELQLDFVDDRFTLAIPGVATLDGSALADRGCCSMPENVWYEPLATVFCSVVGNSTECRFESASDGALPWTYEDANNAFVASFR